MSAERYALPDYAQAAVHFVWKDVCRVHWNIHQKNFNDSRGFDFLGLPGVAVRPYDWNCEDEAAEQPNIEINGVCIWWYKYFGRGMEANVNWTPDQWAVWLRGCLAALTEADKAHRGY